MNLPNYLVAVSMIIIDPVRQTFNLAFSLTTQPQTAAVFNQKYQDYFCVRGQSFVFKNGLYL